MASVATTDTCGKKFAFTVAGAVMVAAVLAALALSSVADPLGTVQ
jgi:hypothetical protein